MASLLAQPHDYWNEGAVYSGFCSLDPCYYGCFCGLIEVEESGGDEGFSLTFNFNAITSNAVFVVNGDMINIKDRLKVYTDTTLKFDSGCISGTYNSGEVAIPQGTTTMKVEVIPNCDGGTGTLWSFTLQMYCKW